MDVRLTHKTQTLLSSCIILVLVSSVLMAGTCPGDHQQCYDCKTRVMKPRHREKKDSPNKYRVSIWCTFPCITQNKVPHCRSGVNVILDGCQCCRQCARQQGDMCDTLNRCDEEKNLECDFGRNVDYIEADKRKLKGQCRAKQGQSCRVNGYMYKSEEKFKPSCNTLCSCQNGIVSCSSLCPQELERPSNCQNATLTRVNDGICCKEWVCTDATDLPADSPVVTTVAPVQRQTFVCKVKTSGWSPCSVSCDVGTSFRVTNDNADCKPKKQFRLCQLRPCGHRDITVEGVCRPTTKPKGKVNIRWDGCTSVKKWNLKYCSTCKENRCCSPNVDKTVTMDFYCEDKNITVTTNYMWIKNCKCYRTCDEYWAL